MVDWGLHLLNDLWKVIKKIHRPPYQAGNMADLAKMIRNKPLAFPNEIKICDDLKDVVKKMLTVDVKKRIEWHELFNHPITNYFSKKQKHEV